MTMPNSRLLSSLFLSCSLLSSPGIAQESSDEAVSGGEILRQFVERHQLDYESEQLTITLTDSQGNQIVREMRRYTRKEGDGKYRHLAVFDAPAGIEGTALLTWQQAGRPDHHWTYLPAFGKVRKQGVTPGSSRKYFMGTDLTYEDIASEDTDKYDYQRLEDQTIDGVEHYVVRATAATPEMKKETGYSHRDLYLHKDNYVLVRVDYFDNHEKFIKRMTAVEPPVAVEGDAWRLDHVLIENEREQHSTEMVVNSRVLGEDEVPKRMFSPNFLSGERHMK